MSKFNFALAYVMATVTTRKEEERGATAVEYGLLVSLIAVAIIIAVTALGGKLGLIFQGVSDKLTAPA